MSKHAFALQWLDFLGNKVYNKGEQIFLYDGKDPSYEINPYGMLDTKIRYGQKFWDAGEESEDNYTRISWPEFDELGYAIKSDSNPEYLWLPRQRCCYMIMKKRRDTIGLSQSAYNKACQQTNMMLEHDAISRRFRLKGNNVLADPNLPVHSGIGEWVYYDEDKPKVIIPRKMRNLSREESRAMMKSQMYGESIGTSSEYQPIKEIPILISEDKKIICIRKENICQRILCTGASRKGKSTFVNGFATRVVYKFQDRVGWLIDPQNQFYDISLPQEYQEFIKINSWINENPIPLPAIHYYLACKHPNLIAHKDISLKLTLDFEEFLKKYSFFSYGESTWSLDKPGRYLTEVIPYIKNVENVKELNDKLYEHIPNANDAKKGDGMRSMIFKWKSSFKNIFNERFTSNMFKMDPMETHELEIELKDGTKMKGHPFIMAMEAGLVPLNNTSMVPEKPWVRNYMADLMQKMLSHQKIQGQKGTRTRKWMIVDEMQEIFEKKSGKKIDNASIAFEKLFRQGGFQDIGFVGNTQSLEKLNDEMIKNATHICCVYTQSSAERKIIRDIFELDKEITSKIGELDVQEMMVFSKEPFVVYDRWGRRTVEEDKTWFKGRIIPPPNYHKSPKLKGG